MRLKQIPLYAALALSSYACVPTIALRALQPPEEPFHEEYDRFAERKSPFMVKWVPAWEYFKRDSTQAAYGPSNPAEKPGFPPDSAIVSLDSIIHSSF